MDTFLIGAQSIRQGFSYFQGHFGPYAWIAFSQKLLIRERRKFCPEFGVQVVRDGAANRRDHDEDSQETKNTRHRLGFPEYDRIAFFGILTPFFTNVKFSPSA